MPLRALSVAVVGAGIGGLAAALSLRRVGMYVRVFERAPEIKEVGAGLGVWANAVRILDRLGAGEAIRAVAQPMERAGIFSRRGRALSLMDMREFSRALGVSSFVMHRTALQKALLSLLPAEVVSTGFQCVGLHRRGGKVELQFKDRPPFEADLVVGADGFHSVIRRNLFGETATRFSGQTCYRGVVRMTVKHPGLLAEFQGTGQRLGHCPFAKDRMYWFACHNAAPNEPEDTRGAKVKLVEMFAGWPYAMEEVIAATPDESIIRSDLSDRVPLKTWGADHVTLLGDAAHPMLPNLGQGACTAIEDGAVLAQCLTQAETVDAALRNYEARRIPRTTRLVTLSWRFGIAARWTNPLAVRCREAILKATPENLARQELMRQVGYDAFQTP